jgi:hypothetical protein
MYERKYEKKLLVYKSSFFSIYINFMDELGQIPIFTKKKFRRSVVCRNFMAVQMQTFFRLLFEKSYQVRDIFFWMTEGIGLIGVSFHFDFGNKFSRVGAIRIFGSYFPFT